MKDPSPLVRVGERAPDFALKAANCFEVPERAQAFSLRELTSQGAVIVEFVRGTW